MAEEQPYLDVQVDEVLAEITRVLEDVRLHLGDDAEPERWGLTGIDRAFLFAQRDAIRRSLEREGEGWESLSTLVGRWLLDRAGGGVPAETVASALAAAHAAREASADPLPTELRDFVKGYLDGSIRDDEFARRLRARAGE
jgi:hypothetical protein